MEQPKASANYPLSTSSRIVGEAGAWAEDPVDVVTQYIRLYLHDGTCHLLRDVRSRREMEVGESRTFQRHVWIAVIVIANAIVDGQSAIHLPCIFRKHAEGGFLVAVVVWFWLSCNRIVREISFAIRVVVDEINHVGVRDVRLAKGARKQSDIITAPCFKALLDARRANHPGEDIAPVIAVLDVIAVGETISPSCTQVSHVYDWNGEEAGVGRVTFNPVVAEYRFVQDRW